MPWSLEQQLLRTKYDRSVCSAAGLWREVAAWIKPADVTATQFQAPPFFSSTLLRNLSACHSLSVTKRKTTPLTHPITFCHISQHRWTYWRGSGVGISRPDLGSFAGRFSRSKDEVSSVFTRVWQPSDCFMKNALFLSLSLRLPLFLFLAFLASKEPKSR